MNIDKVIFVSSGMLSPKKWDNRLAREHLYINYGLLGLASILSQKGYSVEVLDGKFEDTHYFVNRLLKNSHSISGYPLFLSLPSYYALPWARLFCQLLKDKIPHIKIVIGGRWVANHNGRWLKSQLPNSDLIVYGTAERRIETLLDTSIWETIKHTNISSYNLPEDPLSEYPSLDYSLLRNFYEYNPSIEISRGCGMGCSFCVERNVPRMKMRTPESTISSIEKLCDLYQDNSLRIYFESSYFQPNPSWTARFKELYKMKGLSIKWRTETRVEGISPKNLYDLADSGLRIIDLGLESASPTQLTRMRKCQDTKGYLNKASNLLKKCRDLGIWTKVNILLFPGETEDTIKETMDWLSLHDDCIKGISAGPLVIYLGVETNRYLEYLKKFGTVSVDDSLKKKGYVNLHLSKNMDFSKSVLVSKIISKKFMTDKDYFELKSFSYFSRRFTYEKFNEIAKNISSDNRSFRLSAFEN